MVSFCLTSQVGFASPALASEAPYHLLFPSQIVPFPDGVETESGEITGAGMIVLSQAQDIAYLRTLATERPAPATPQEVYDTQRQAAQPAIMTLISVALDDSHQISRHLVASDVILPLLPHSYDEAAPWAIWREGDVFYGLLPHDRMLFAPDIYIRFEVAGFLTHQHDAKRIGDTAHGTLIFDSGEASLVLSLIDSAAQHHRLTAPFSDEALSFLPAILESGGQHYDASLAASFFTSQDGTATLVGFLTHQTDAPVLGGLVSGVAAVP